MRRSRGGAYVLVLTAAMILFLLTASALTVTTSSRRVTERYPYYGNLYDMAVAGNERVIERVRLELAARRAVIDAQARQALLTGDLAARLVYRDGSFRLAAPGGYAALYRQYAHEAVAAVLSDIMNGAKPGEWRDTGEITVSFYPGEPGAAISGAAVTDTYRLETVVTRENGGYRTVTAATKIINGVPSHPMVVDAVWEWPAAPPYEILFIPAYGWKDPPDYLSVCLYAAGDIFINGAAPPPGGSGFSYQANRPPLDFIDVSLADALAGFNARALRVTSASALDVSALYGGEPFPLFVLNTAGGPLTLFASDPAHDRFTGVLVCFGDLTLDAVGVTGTVIAGGRVHVSAPAPFDSDENILFKITAEPLAKQVLFDLMGLSAFTAAEPDADAGRVLGRLAFDVSGLFGPPCEIVINNFDAVLPAMVESKKIAN